MFSSSLRYKLVLSYDGTRYAGWQVQPNGLSIQECVTKELKRLLRHPMHLVGAGRTDAGVHAEGQVAHFDTLQTLDAHHFLYSLNSLLPRDIRVVAIEEVSEQFHARYSATGKIYHYHLWLEPVISPFRRLYAYHQPRRIDRFLLKEASQFLLGKQNFAALANRASEGAAAKNPVRTLRRLDLVDQEGGLRLEFEGDGFLYKMVRNSVGTLLECAAGKLSLQQLQEGLKSRNRSLLGQAAPAHGLCLKRVLYAI